MYSDSLMCPENTQDWYPRNCGPPTIVVFNPRRLEEPQDDETVADHLVHHNE